MAEANEKETDKVADQLQNTGISSGPSDGAATSGQFSEFFALSFKVFASNMLLSLKININVK